MEKRIAHRKTGAVLAAAAAAAGLAGLGASKADASLIVDVRATAVNGTATSDKKSVASLQAGDVVTFAVFAQVSGTNGINDDTVSIVSGSFSSTGGLLGNLSNALTAQFSNPSVPGFTNGNQSDFDSDGDLDVGSAGTTATNKMAARSGAVSGTPIDSNTSEIQVSTLTFTVTGGSGSAAVNFIPRSTTLATGATWNEDGVATVKSPAAGGTFAAGTPVNVSGGVATTPEPASIGLLGLASVGLLARRRDKKA